MNCMFFKSNSNKTYIIAEAADQHFGSVENAFLLIEGAKNAGADCIKFQHHLPDEEMLPDVPMSDNFDQPLYEFLKENAFTIEQHKEVKDYCDEVGIQYLCTPFSLKAAEELLTLNVEFFKIGSGDMTDTPTISAIADMGLPMIVSTGMSTFEEIDRTYELLSSKNIQFALMNCTSEYPPIYEDINLKVITEMQDRYPNAAIGHSDHTGDLVTSYGAVTLGARLIEKHIILDKNISAPDQKVSIDLDELKQLVKNIRNLEKSLGNEKKVNLKENSIREWAFRSIISLRKINSGEEITQDMIWSKRPGTGIPSHKMDEVIGKIAVKDIENNTLINWEDLN